MTDQKCQGPNNSDSWYAKPVEVDTLVALTHQALAQHEELRAAYERIDQMKYVLLEVANCDSLPEYLFHQVCRALEEEPK